MFPDLYNSGPLHWPRHLPQNLLIMTKKFLFLTLFSCLSGLAWAASFQPTCDTILTSEGKTYYCQILEQTEAEVQFSLCDDVSGAVYTMPQERVRRIGWHVASKEPAIEKVKLPKKQQPPTVKAKHAAQKPEPDTAEYFAQKALNNGVLGLICSLTILFSPIGFLLGLFAIHRGRKALKKAKGQPNYRKIRRKVIWTMILGGLSIALALSFFVLFWVLVSKFQGIGPFDFGDVSLLPEW